MTPGRTYLSGPMSGVPELNMPAFRAVAAAMRARGIEVVSPAEVSPDPDATWEDALRADVRALTGCDAIALMDGWSTSRGARLEFHVAAELGLRIGEVSADGEWTEGVTR